MSQLVRQFGPRRWAQIGWGVHSIAIVLVLGLFLGAVRSGVAVADAAPPTATVEGLLGALSTYTDGTALSPAEQTQNARARRIAKECLRPTVVAERAFGARWGTLTRAQQTEFIQIFTALLEEKAYPKSGTFFADLEIEYLGEMVRDNKATVKTLVIHPDEGEIGIDYRVERINGEWIVVDVLLDGASLALDIRAQVQKFLVAESFAALIQRMNQFKVPMRLIDGESRQFSKRLSSRHFFLQSQPN